VHPRAGRRRRHQLERARLAVVREQAFPAAEHDRLDHQAVLVDQTAADKRPGEIELPMTWRLPPSWARSRPTSPTTSSEGAGSKWSSRGPPGARSGRRRTSESRSCGRRTGRLPAPATRPPSSARCAGRRATRPCPASSRRLPIPSSQLRRVASSRRAGTAVGVLLRPSRCLDHSVKVDELADHDPHSLLRCPVRLVSPAQLHQSVSPGS